MTGDITFVRGETEEEAVIRCQMLAEMERQEAYRAVAQALATHRWWGWGSLVRSFRMWLTGLKFRIGMKLWP